MGIIGLLNIGQSALSVAQQALNVVGQNVANVNTPGYSRQVAVQAELPPMNGSPGQIGTGVQVTQIQRIVDTFINQQLTTSNSALGQLNIANDQLSQIQNLFGDSTNQGIGTQLTNFFSSLQDVASNPSDATSRSVLLGKAGFLTSGFNQVASALSAQQSSVNDQVKQTITDINGLSKQIADLNGQIVSVEMTGQNPNDLLDQRDQAINNLAKDVNVSVVNAGNGAVSVYVGQGQAVVENTVAHNLVAVQSPNTGGMVSVHYDLGHNNSSDISSYISGGQLGGLLNIRDTIIPGLQTSFDKLSASLVNEVNQIHRQGYGLDGSTGLNFFSPLSVTTQATATNQGSASLANGIITANSLLTLQDYAIKFSSPTSYAIVNATTGATIKGNYTGTALTPPPTVDAPVNIITGTNDTLAVTVDGTASGTITLTGAASPGQAYTSGTALATELQQKINADATLSAAGKSVAVTYDTTTNRFTLTSNASTATSAVDVTGGTARATLGLSAGISTAASGTYSGPQTFTVDGLQVTLSGAASAKDAFSFNSYSGTAKSISLSVTNASQVAASSTRAGVPGNNDTVMALVALQTKAVSTLGSTTFSATYGTIASGVGTTAQSVTNNLTAQTAQNAQLTSLRAQTSGVSIDEEMTKLLMYQREYEAASRLIVSTDEMLQTLIAMRAPGT